MWIASPLGGEWGRGRSRGRERWGLRDWGGGGGILRLGLGDTEREIGYLVRGIRCILDALRGVRRLGDRQLVHSRG